MASFSEGVSAQRLKGVADELVRIGKIVDGIEAGFAGSSPPDPSDVLGRLVGEIDAVRGRIASETDERVADCCFEQGWRVIVGAGEAVGKVVSITLSGLFRYSRSGPGPVEKVTGALDAFSHAKEISRETERACLEELEALERVGRLATDLRARSERMRRIYATKISARRGNSAP
ncbi:MAG: hypothetical protein OXF02_01870 [Simkaniaceae bacterium]|nr:hypothetical protein [Simkaniaceae bacterium]